MEKRDRVHKIIAQAGVMSRRKAEEAILAGRVAVNGEVLSELGRLADPETDVITVDGQRIELKQIKKTFLFHKPRGVITSKSDDRGRQTVMDFFKDDPTLNPVGRLDFESEGLLLLTHDGDLALKLTHPRYGVKKIYEVEVGDLPADSFIEAMLKGVPLEDGVGKFDHIEEMADAKPATSQQIIAPATKHYRVTVSEGRNRFVRRMFEHFGASVRRLKRVQLGEYLLGDLKPGERREVT